MQYGIKLKRWVAAILASVFFVASLQSMVANAAMVSTPQAVQTEQLHYDKAQILEKLQDERAQQILQSYGVSSADVEKRVQAMTPAEVADFNAKASSMPAGGTSIFGVVIFVLVLLIVLDLLGATDIFPVIKPLGR
ncbi:PA2779 family protein [Marinobacteraceae bacterium S3BR75-40.1]